MSTIRVVNIQHSDATEPNIVLNADGTATFVSGITISGGTNLTVSGTAEFASGTVSAPSITFIDDNNTGIYEPAADTVAITTAATERLRVDSSGRVGIGTTSPGANLDISPASSSAVLRVHARTDTNAVPALELQRGASTTWGSDAYMDYRIKNAVGELIVEYGQSGGTGEWMRIDSFGRLLVGTSSASNNTGVLVVQGYAGVTAGEGTLDLVRGNNVTAAVQGLGSINFGHSQYQGASIDAVSEGAWTESSSHPANLSFSTTADGASSPTERMLIDSSGNIGIGGSPTVFTGQNFISVHSPGTSTNIAGLDFYISSTRQAGLLSYPSIGESLRIFANTANSITIHNNGSERMRIESSGNVNIGRNGNHTDSTARLSVFNSGASASWSVRPGTNVANQIDFISYNYGTATYLPTRSIADSWIWFDGANGERMRIDSSGRLLVGTTSLSNYGTVNAYSNTSSPALRTVGGSSMALGSAVVAFDKHANTNTTSQVFAVFTINVQNTGSGQINANGASQAAFGSFSDRRLKENIVDLSSQLDNVCKLRPVEFDYIESEGGGHQISFIAQEFEEVYPDAISEREDGMKILTGWSKTEAILVKALQEAVAKIETLEAKVAALESA